MKGFSVVICCFNSQARLPETLSFLFRQETGKGLNWEVIIVDNASTDQTVGIAEGHSGRFLARGIGFKIVSEWQQGLSFAREKGVLESIYEYIIFCDDDNWLDSAFVRNAFAVMESDEHIGALGGRSDAATDGACPEWFDDHKAGYAVGRQAERSADITRRGYVWGAGMVTRRTLFLETVSKKYPSLLTDRSGSKIVSGGDYEYCLRLVLKGYKIYYSDSLVLTHFIPAARLTTAYRDKLVNSFEESGKTLLKYHLAIDLKKSPKLLKLKFAVSALLDAAGSWLRRRKVNSFTLTSLFYFLNANWAGDREMKIIKHFYDA